MATIRPRKRRDGSVYYQVRYRVNGIESSTSLNDENDAIQLQEMIDRMGAMRALAALGLITSTTGFTVESWLIHHIEHLSGIEQRTRHEYLGIVTRDIVPVLGGFALENLTRDHVALWLESMRVSGAAAKTIANKHGLLSAALNAAVRAGHIPSNPAVGVRLPRSERGEMRFLSHEEFAALVAEIPDYWQPMIRFMVSSGARLSEVTALRPSDVNRAQSTVRIVRAWKRNPDGHEIGAPKTQRSIRTINVPKSVLDDLTYDNDWLFINSGRGARSRGGPVRASNLRVNVWVPAVERVWPSVDADGKALKHPPHPRLHDLRHTCASWLIQGGTPLPVVQAHLGHESIKTTVDRYGHLDRRNFSAAADIIGAALGAGIVGETPDTTRS